MTFDIVYCTTCDLQIFDVLRDPIFRVFKKANFFKISGYIQNLLSKLMELIVKTFLPNLVMK
jgi:hypothetical protein